MSWDEAHRHVNATHKYIHDLLFNRVYQNNVDKVRSIQNFYRKYKVAPDKSMRKKSLNFVSFAKIFGTITMRFRPEKRAFDRIAGMWPRMKDLRTRTRKRGEKKEWLKDREYRRVKVQHVKLNFIHGILRRFFFSFLDEFNYDKGGTSKMFARAPSLSNVYFDQNIMQ